MGITIDGFPFLSKNVISASIFGSLISFHIFFCDFILFLPLSFWLCICVVPLANVCGALRRVCIFWSCLFAPVLDYVSYDV